MPHSSIRRDLRCAAIVFVFVVISTGVLLGSMKAACILGGVSIMATLILRATAQETYYAVRSRRWPSTLGIVLASQTLSVPGNRFAASIKIRYFVDGIVYYCQRIQFGPQSSLRPDVEKQLLEYQEGKQVAVYYNPHNPGIGICKPGFNRSFLVYLIVVAVCSYGGAVILLEAIRGKL